MTISNQDARTGPYNGNGSTTSFAYDFKVIDEDHLVVTLKNSSDVETVQTITTHYTVTGVGAAGGGTVEMVTAPASGETLTISRAVPLTQEVDLANRGGVQPEVLETAYDKLTQALQDQEELHSRVPRFPVSSSLTNVELPLTLTAGAALRVNSTADGFENGPTADQITSAQSYAEAAQAALDEFTDLYLGAKASDPALDNDGNALQDGALYFDTTNNVMKVYDLGTTTWKRTTPTSGEQANIDTVTGIAANVTTVAGISANVTTVAGIAANVTTVAGAAADVTTVAGISADVTVAATNVADITNFADVYIGPSASDPTQRADTSALQAGDLYFNTTSNVMRVYTGSAWINAALVAADVLQVANNLSDLDNTGTARTNLGVAIGSDVQAFDADALFADTTDTLTVGYATTPYSAGTKSSGTYTPDEANGGFQYAVNGGAHTLAPPTNDTSLVIQYTNDASAGAITTSGFTIVTGDTITTTDGDDFLFFITKNNGFSHLNVVALQ
jgi:hypothetical protein